MDVSVLHIDDCPNWVETGSRLRTALNNVDGEDLFPSNGGTTDLACRVYQTDGRLAGLPSLADIEAALRQHNSGV